MKPGIAIINCLLHFIIFISIVIIIIVIIVYIIIIVKPGLSGKEQLASSSGHQTWFKVVTIMHLAIISQILGLI